MTITTDPSKSSFSKQGFTLIEMLIAMLVASIAMGIAIGSIMFLTRGMVGLVNYSDMNMKGRGALEIFSRDVRTGVRVETATGTDFIFDVANENNRIDKVEYNFNSSTGIFKRRVDGGPWDVLIDKISDFDLRYFNLIGNETNTPLEVKEVQLELISEKQALQLTNTNHIISAKFMMRNKSVSN